MFSDVWNWFSKSRRSTLIKVSVIARLKLGGKLTLVFSDTSLHQTLNSIWNTWLCKSKNAFLLEAISLVKFLVCGRPALSRMWDGTMSVLRCK